MDPYGHYFLRRLFGVGFQVGFGCVGLLFWEEEYSLFFSGSAGEDFLKEYVE